MELKARILKWRYCYSIAIDLPHKSFNIDSNNYKTAEYAKRVGNSLAARMGWKLVWDKDQKICYT